MAQPFKHYVGYLTLAATAWTVNAVPAMAAEFGKDVVNVASVTYDNGGGNATTVVTNEAVFTIQAPRVPAAIEFFRYSPNAPQPIHRQIHGSDYSPSGNLDGPFTTVGPARTAGGAVIDITSEIPLIPATTYLTGELMFVRVIDTGRNADSTAIDTVAITIIADNGDEVVLQMYESGPDTGEFWAYIPSTKSQTATNDPELTTGGNTRMTATYVDVFDSTDVVIDSALVDPYGIVFDSVTGDPVDGARVTLIDISTGQQADVFGVDGFSSYPSSVISGDTTTDASGLIYEIEDGEFRFPLAAQGEYLVRVDPPEGYNFASVMDQDYLTSINNGEYVILDASFGAQFTLEGVEPLRFDIPLDPDTDLVLTKDADRTYADVGDYINYTVTVNNAGQSSAPVTIHDTLPLGFRYVPGTSRREVNFIADPSVSDDAALLTFPMGVVAPGETVSLTYTLLMGPGAPIGSAINEAVVRDGSGDQISNIARAEVLLREDLLRSRTTIVGRITENSCDGDEDWAREIQAGTGVEGVRIYTETGAYAVSDSTGLFHFEGVTTGTHVVQIDEETLPQGYEPMVCEANSRYAGSATSKFVDVQGGGIWRANFYLKQTGETAQEQDTVMFNDATEYKEYDAEWLETQTAEPAWVYPNTSRTPSKPSINIGIKHGANEKVALSVNGNPVSSMNLAARDGNSSRTAFLSRWRGIDILEGRNDIVAVITNAQGATIRTLTEEVSYVKTIARAVGVPDQSELVADGRTIPMVAIRLEDEAGRPVHAGRIAKIDVETPYRMFDETVENMLLEETSELLAPLTNRKDLPVGPDGIVRVQLEPTLRTGKVTVIVTLDNGRQVPIYMYLEPEKRDWIIVGLAEGSAGLENVKANGIDLGDSGDDVITDGRVAFFAKGLIKGNWLMTMAVDTDKRRGDRDSGFQDEIDPNAYYTLYGDRSYQEYEGISRYPVFVKLEKSTAYAMFGDYDTNITEGRLTAYNRRLSGLKAEYLGDNIQVLGFAAETNQGFAKDELAADGTSGTYNLSNSRILPQSEEIVIETRDRNRPDVIIDRKVMVRYLDYTLDYFTGDLIFRLPVDATDIDFNPNVIVVDYETSEEAERNVTFGGRVQTQILDDKVQIGSTFVHEDGSALESGSEQNMIGVDVVAQVSDNTEVRAEYAITDDTSGDGGTSKAILAEVIHTSEKLSTEAYFRQEDGGFGLGQRNSNTNGIRRYGVNSNYRIEIFEDEETGRRGSRSIEAAAFREENLGTGESRNTGELIARHDGDKWSASGGIRASHDDLIGREDRDSILAIGSASLNVPKHGATFQISHEQPLGNDGEVSAYPQRTTLGVDKTIGQKATASIRHEMIDGENQNSHNTTVGLTTTPWTGGTITAASDLLTNDSGRRLGGTVGLDQQVRLSDKWSVSAGIRNRTVFDAEEEFIEVTPDAAISPFEVNEDFTSAYVGAGYRSEIMSGSARLEARNASDGDTWTASAGVARELSEELSVAGAARGFIREPAENENSSSRLDVRLGTAWRPRDEDLIIFDRFDVSHENNERGETKTKIVNNIAANAMVSDRWQLAANYGIKHVKADVAGQKLSNTSHLVGAETRFDITDKIDIGLRGMVMTSSGTNGLEYSYGPSIGVTPVKNVWISAGYNVEGFKDDDFAAAETSREGVYLQMRIKFDQNTARGLLRKISPSSVITANDNSQKSFATGR